MSLADRIWAEFERTGLPFLEELASATAIRDFLLPGLDEPPSSHYWIIRLALLCKAIGPQEAYERAMALLEHFPGPATYRSHARDHWHMIQRFEP